MEEKGKELMEAKESKRKEKIDCCLGPNISLKIARKTLEFL